MTDISPITQTSPLVDNKGFVTVFFKTFLDQVIARIGGISGGIYNAISNTMGSVIWDLNLNPNGFIALTQPTTTITAINQVAGAPPYRITIIQDAVGGRLVTWGSNFKFPSGIVPTLSTGANAVDILVFASDGTNMLFQYGQKDLR